MGVTRRKATPAAPAAAKTPDDPVATAVAAAALAARKAAEARARPGGALYLPERISVPAARVALNKFRCALVVASEVWQHLAHLVCTARLGNALSIPEHIACALRLPCLSSANGCLICENFLAVMRGQRLSLTLCRGVQGGLAARPEGRLAARPQPLPAARQRPQVAPRSPAPGQPCNVCFPPAFAQSLARWPMRRRRCSVRTAMEVLAPHVQL